ncbi:nitrogenase molybdenum-iron protein beta chain [Sporobacter termitidis DSM 10068]|uniref:Nitrogenase molybdenum-iron protein beta chain n=1 Tax=Sporobacter termitidis DSM 10068 TaxID=1123282 RepID=A0A1M5TUZ5_9FIRM|nr:nitrogenase component 1 [Sporobacter termitidis]SHH54416.1 nitrogenase molybdenum-iron protein beta chain [Sporobacter termitidis DSM 10068]
MSKFVDRPRYTCALGGALATLRAIPRAIPIIHASAGCGQNLYNANNPGGGYSGGGYCGGNSLPSSNVVERDIVFGGEDRLREQITTTLEVMDGDVYFVLTGCMVEMIGDDLDAIVTEFAGTDRPVIAVHTPSFRGNSFTGYELVLSALIKKYVAKQEQKEPRTVNILGIVPIQDVFWEGNLKEIKRLLEKLGLKVNTLFGEGEGLGNIKDSGAAALNIVVSDTYGLDAAQVYEEVHGIPFITTGFPVGADATEAFLKEIAKALSIDAAVTEKVIREEKAVYYSYLERVSDIYNDIDLQRYAVVVADANYAPAVTRFLSDELGWLPELVVITDFVNDAQKELLLRRFENLESGLQPEVRFDTDASSVRKYLSQAWPRNHNEKYYDAFSPAVVVGSVFERDLATEFGFPLLVASYPVTNRVVLNHAYAGFSGALTLTEDLLGLLVAGR